MNKIFNNKRRGYRRNWHRLHESRNLDVQYAQEKGMIIAITIKNKQHCLVLFAQFTLDTNRRILFPLRNLSYIYDNFFCLFLLLHTLPCFCLSDSHTGFHSSYIRRRFMLLRHVFITRPAWFGKNTKISSILLVFFFFFSFYYNLTTIE